MGRKLLTDLAVEKLTGGASRREIADAGMASRGGGLYVIVQSTGSKSWALRYRYGGRPRKLTLGQYPAIDLAKARGRAQAALEALDRGEDPAVAQLDAVAQQHRPSADRESFAVLIRRWFEAHAIPRQRSWRETARLIGLKVIEHEDGTRTFEEVPGGIVARWAERAVHGIRRRDIRELLEASKARGATTTANRELSALKTFFGWCVDGEIIEVSPAARLAKPAPENRRTRILTDTELRLAWLAGAAEGYPFGDIVRLLMLTAQRRGEVAGARWVEFDLKARTWTIPKERTKNGLPHLVPLSDTALALLEDMPRFKGGDFLFGLGGRTGFTGYSKGKARIDKRVGELAGATLELPEWNLHDLRRTGATGMAKLGVMPHVVEAVLNHISGSKAGVAGIYNLWSYEAEKREALARWAEHVERVAAVDAASRVVTMIKRGSAR
jgi:integrase